VYLGGEQQSGGIAEREAPSREGRSEQAAIGQFLHFELAMELFLCGGDLSAKFQDCQLPSDLRGKIRE